MTSRFQSTHPARGATPYWCVLARPAFHFNPRTPRGVRRDGMSAPMRGGDFNPRTPRGVRQYAGADLEAIEKISIHAPREGCDYYKSKRPSWSRYFNPRTPRGVRQQRLDTLCHIPRISIHAPREGCDRFLVSATYTPVLFQSTHPARGATANFTKEQRVCLAQFAYLHKGKKAEHTKTNAPMLHEAFLYAFWVRTGRRRRVLLDFARYKIKGSSGR